MSVAQTNIVQFAPTSAEGSAVSIAVEFEDGFTLQAGLRPSVNEARCSNVEFQKLGGGIGQIGALNWYFTTPPGDAGSPDLVIQSVALVEAAPVRFGMVNASDGSGATPQPIEWRLSFADFRESFVPPRGGRLAWGLVNPSDAAAPSDQSAGTDGGSGTPFANSVLIQRCLDAMGQGGVTVPPQVDQVDPPSDLQWHGNNPSIELAKLLELVGAVFCPHVDGTATIEMMGEGTAPPDGLFTLPIGAVDLRGKTVIVTSAPTATLLTYTISGPDDDTWQYVVQDIDGTWQNIDDNPSILAGNDPVDLIQSGFTQLLSGTVPNKYLLRLQKQLYFCIRLSPDQYPPSLQPVLRQRLEAFDSDGNPAAPADPQILAKVAIPPGQTGVSGGGATNATGTTQPVDCGVSLLLGGTVLMSGIRLGKLGPGADGTTGGNYNANFAELDDGDLSVRLTQEKVDVTDPDNPVPVYWEVGFQLQDEGDDGGGLTQMSPADVTSAIESPDRFTLFIHRPDLRLLNVDGNDQGLDALTQDATAIADAILNDDSQVGTQTRCQGIVPVDCGGQVSKVVFLQRQSQTLINANDWWHGGAEFYQSWQKRVVKSHRGAHPHQDVQAAKRTSLGMSGSTQPAVPIGLPTQAASAVGLFRVKLIVDGGSALNGYTYTVSSLDGSVTYGTNLSPDWRPFNTGLANISNAGGLGNAYYAGTTVKLYEADESYATVGCPY